MCFRAGETAWRWGATTYWHAGSGLSGAEALASRGAPRGGLVNGDGRARSLLPPRDADGSSARCGWPEMAPSIGAMPELAEGTHGCASVCRTRVAWPRTRGSTGAPAGARTPRARQRRNSDDADATIHHSPNRFSWVLEGSKESLFREINPTTKLQVARTGPKTGGHYFGHRGRNRAPFSD